MESRTASDPAVSNGGAEVGRVEARLQAIEAKLGRIEGALDHLGAIERDVRAAVAMTTDAIDRKAAEEPEVNANRMTSLLALLSRLSRPGTVESLGKALDVAEKIPDGLAMATDAVDRMASAASARGIDLADRFVTLGRLVERLTSPEILAVLEEGLAHHEAATRILRSGAFSPPALEVVGKLASAFADAAEAPPRMGLWSAVRASGTQPVQQTIGFALSLAARFGRSITHQDEPRLLEKGGQ